MRRPHQFRRMHDMTIGVPWQVEAPMAPNPEVTKRQLISAAESLFAERGIDGVSLREITVAAGVRNSTALQYHFGTREGLVRAVLKKHFDGIEVHRNALLDEYER